MKKKLLIGLTLLVIGSIIFFQNCSPGFQLGKAVPIKFASPSLSNSSGNNSSIQPATRSFRMGFYDNSEGIDSDLKSFVMDHPQPSGNSVILLQSWSRDDFATYFPRMSNFMGYDFSRIEAFIVDEPFWSVLSQAGFTDWSNPCENGASDSRNQIVAEVSAELVTASQVVKTAAPNARFWINFSEPEVQWQMDTSCSLKLNGTHVDVVSTDVYFVSFQPKIRAYYDWIVANRVKPSQQIGLVPGTFFRDGVDDPNQMAGYIPDFFSYADQMNSQCNKAEDCLVWMVLGWPMGTSGDAPVWRGYLDPMSSAIQNVWRTEFAKTLLP